MTTRKSIHGHIMLLFLLLPAGFALAVDIVPVKPAPEDKCPVCGMFVAKYPDWIGEIIYEDGMTVFFDGAKDLFKYYFNIEKFHPKRTTQDIAAIYVTEYYDVEFIDAEKSMFILGSDVYGPMGRELIPFKNRADAETFKKDHQGEKIVTFSEVTDALIATQD